MGELVSKVSPRPPYAALNFVKTKQRIVFIGKFPSAAAVGVTEGHNSAFPLNPLNTDPRGVLIDGRFQCRDVLGGHKTRPRHQRFKVLAILWLARDSERPQGTSVERIFQGNNFELGRRAVLPVRLDHLQGAFRRLCAAVTEEDTVETAHLRDSRGERPLVHVVEQVGGMDQTCRLIRNGRDNTGVILPQRIDANAGNKVKVAFTLKIEHIGAVSTI